jgi:hypothetical protein
MEEKKEERRVGIRERGSVHLGYRRHVDELEVNGFVAAEVSPSDRRDPDRETRRYNNDDRQARMLKEPALDRAAPD